jgi:nuclear pore complex protein Nup188
MISKQHRSSTDKSLVSSSDYINKDAIMEFLSKAHNSWAPILSTLRQDKALWAKLLILLAWSGIIVDTSDSPEQTLQKCWRLHTAASAVDAIAVEIFHAGSIAQAASIEILRDHLVTKKDVKLQEIASEAFRIRGYRDSLFFHLRRNFQLKFPTADILRFQRNIVRERRFGEEYFFDITVGRAVLGNDPTWAGFEKEIRLANLNMSIVDAQLVFLPQEAYSRNYLLPGSISRLHGTKTVRRHYRWKVEL